MTALDERLAAWNPLTVEELMQLGHAVDGLMQTEGWRYIDGLLRKLEVKIPAEGLRDPKYPREYYLGQLDFIELLRETLTSAAALAKEKRPEKKRMGEDAVLRMMKPGGAGV